MTPATRTPIALTIAGSDSSGGAGIQADLKTFAALQVYGASVVTALTAQNTCEVTAIHDAPADFVTEQIRVVLADLHVGAIKIGMLSRPEVIEAVAAALAPGASRPIVLDPVMVSKSGAKLLQDNAISVLRAKLIPLAHIVTPNLPEASVLADRPLSAVLDEPESACRTLVEAGAKAVVLKGGHAGGPSSDDLFFDGRSFTPLPARRIDTQCTHGTGCTFSSAIAAFLARGETPLDAVRHAKSYVTAAIESAHRVPIGRGHGPVHHFHALWTKGE